MPHLDPDQVTIARALNTTATNGGLISDATARMIATQMADDGDVFAPLAATGEINLPDLTTEIKTGLESFAPDSLFCRALAALDAYIAHHGERGPVPGWAER
uniref:hypothetical protein n=1 Tax=Nonomuraea sp. CA-251285 TaxID=3240002 RepID=UPI003F491439